MFLVVMCIATVLVIIWLVLLRMIILEDWIMAAYNEVFDNRATIDKLQIRDVLQQNRLAQYHGVIAKLMSIFSGGNQEKKVAKLEQNIKFLQNGKLKAVNLFVLPGYVLQRKFTSIAWSSLYKSILNKCNELYGKKHAVNKTKQLLAKMLSYPVIGVAAVLVFGTLFMGLGFRNFGIALVAIGPVVVLTYVYSLYDELSKKTSRRYAAIGRQFPNVVSKLALLVTSGMVMDRAWKETALSQNYELYKEMRRTANELDNLVSPEIAYGNFIKRCNTKETTKLASAIMQNLSKGNSEIGRLLQTLASEAWLERRHRAKRDSEKANSKLLIPIMLLFVAILIMIMAPLAMNFSVF